jgi:hypothetical protein
MKSLVVPRTIKKQLRKKSVKYEQVVVVSGGFSAYPIWDMNETK